MHLQIAGAFHRTGEPAALAQQLNPATRRACRRTTLDCSDRTSSIRHRIG